MIIPAAISQKHELVKPYLSVVSERVRDVVRNYCENQGFAYIGRTKDSDSLAEKIETGRFTSWSDLDDLFACAVIVPGLSDEPRVLEFLRGSFIEVECKAKGESKKDPSMFRFDSTRFIGRVNPATLPQASNDVLSVKFEIQVRTAFEHAWSVTTHAAAYKGVKVDWRYMRLAAQLKASVEQLDQLVLGFEQSANFISSQRWPRVQQLERIHSFFEEQYLSGMLPPIATPKSWSRFCENLYSLFSSLCDRHDLDEMIELGLNAISSELSSSRSCFPMSISLLQFCQGALAKNKLVKKTSKRYVPLITDELLQLFPDSRVYGQGFRFDS